MLFNSLGFLIFFPIVCLIYFLLPAKARVYWLLLASYFFYMCWNVKYVLLLLFCTVCTFIGGLLLSREERSGKKKTILAGTLIPVFLVLFFFKYINFALDGVEGLLSFFRTSVSIRRLDLLLPVGISFYTFQATSYVIDVYRGTIPVEKNPFRYALYVSFFPQLVAGPIERAGDLLPQFDAEHRFDFERLKKGFLIILWGYFLKLVIADRLALFVDTVYANPSTYDGIYLVIATILFAIQLYCDFYGYSSIAVGAAKILGFELSENFQSPYFSCTVAEFWRNWHISLTTWFKDYLYFPLGGSRKGKIRTYVNKIVVFSLSGLWHGASFSFVFWGFINGLYQVVGSILMPIRERVAKLTGFHGDSIGGKALRGIMTFIFVDLSLAFFRAQTFANTATIFKNMFRVRNFWILFDGSLYNCGLDMKNLHFAFLCILILIFADICKKRKISLSDVLLKQDRILRCLIFAGAVIFILVFGKYGPAFDTNNFIYFQF